MQAPRSAIGFLCVLCALAAPEALASDIDLRVDVLSGGLEFVNTSGSDITFSGYTIRSSSASLNFDDWTPIAGRLDASNSGDSSFDDVAQWLVFTLEDTNEDLSEGALSGPGGVLGAGQSISLGDAWLTSGLMDVTVSFLINEVSTTPEAALFIAPGDYNLDGQVDSGDFLLYRETYGSTTDLRADGNGDGVVNSADYAFWRNALPVGGGSGASANAVSLPEPTSAALLLLAAGISVSAGRRARPALA